MRIPKISKKTLIYRPSKPGFPTKEEVEECWEEIDKIMIQNFKDAEKYGNSWSELLDPNISRL